MTQQQSIELAVTAGHARRYAVKRIDKVSVEVFDDNVFPSGPFAGKRGCAEVVVRLAAAGGGYPAGHCLAVWRNQLKTTGA